MLDNHHQKNPRFYIIAITVIIAGIFLVLFINDTNEGVSFTSAIIGVQTETPNDQLEPDTTTIEQKEITTKDQEIDFELSFDQIPTINEEVKVSKIELNFKNNNDEIELNNNQLELNNVEMVNLNLEEFKGQINFDEQKISLEGTAVIIKVNEIGLASKEKMEISFKDIDYNKLKIQDLELKTIDLQKGTGTFSITNKLEYNLNNDQMNLKDFFGEIEINKENSPDQSTDLMNLKGTANSLNVEGNLNLNLN